MSRDPFPGWYLRKQPTEQEPGFMGMRGSLFAENVRVIPGCPAAEQQARAKKKALAA